MWESAAVCQHPLGLIHEGRVYVRQPVTSRVRHMSLFEGMWNEVYSWKGTSQFSVIVLHRARCGAR
jgi:hypothetical protein